MRSRWFGLVIAAVAVAISIWAYPSLPPSVATHWNLRGTPDGFSSRLVAVAIGPLLIVGITLLFNVLPKFDPRRENYAKFRSTYWLFANAVIAFMLIIHGIVIATGLGYSVRIDRLMPLFVGLLFVVIGNYLTRVEPNWFVGIRTPWTLSSDTVWRKTHRTGGGLMVLGGLIVATAAFLPHAALLPLLIAALVVAAVVPVVLSYVLWKRERGAGSGEQP
ncbi:MAG TPA: SdpI family protein [Gemmatimonadales bacterium]|nr:SdpI family protein [Gemmatimonadales bacterium]